MFELHAADMGHNDEFGWAVAIDGNVAIVGAQGAGSPSGHDAGAAYIYDLSTGQQLLTLTPSDGTQFNAFGCDVAIHGNVAVVGAAESAYVFDATTGQELFKLTASGTSYGSFFGAPVATNGRTVMVGACRDDHLNQIRAGSAYIFDARTGQQLAKLTASDASSDAGFGRSMDMLGSTAIVGAAGHCHSDTVMCGSAYVFDLRANIEGRDVGTGNSVAAKWYPCNALPGDLTQAYLSDRPGGQTENFRLESPIKPATSDSCVHIFAGLEAYVPYYLSDLAPISWTRS